MHNDLTQKFRNIFLFCLFLGCAACSSHPVEEAQTASASLPFRPGFTRLSFVRSASIVGMGYSARIRVNNVQVADLGRAENYVGDFAPGLTTITVDASLCTGEKTLQINTAPNTEYVIMISISPKHDLLHEEGCFDLQIQQTTALTTAPTSVAANAFSQENVRAVHSGGFCHVSSPSMSGSSANVIESPQQIPAFFANSGVPLDVGAVFITHMNQWLTYVSTANQVFLLKGNASAMAGKAASDDVAVANAARALCRN